MSWSPGAVGRRGLVQDIGTSVAGLEQRCSHRAGWLCALRVSAPGSGRPRRRARRGRRARPSCPGRGRRRAGSPAGGRRGRRRSTPTEPGPPHTRGGDRRRDDARAAGPGLPHAALVHPHSEMPDAGCGVVQRDDELDIRAVRRGRRDHGRCAEVGGGELRGVRQGDHGVRIAEVDRQAGQGGAGRLERHAADLHAAVAPLGGGRRRPRPRPTGRGR